MRLIELTFLHKGDGKILVNPEHISSVRECGDHRMVRMTNGDGLSVREEAQEIVGKIIDSEMSCVSGFGLRPKHPGGAVYIPTMFPAQGQFSAQRGCEEEETRG